MKRVPLFFLIAMIALLARTAVPVMAADATWNGQDGFSNDWTSAANWVAGAAPGDAVAANNDVATFSTIFNTWGGSVANPITFSSDWHIGSMTFTAAANSCFIGSALFDLYVNSGGAISIASLSAPGITQTIQAPIMIEGAGAEYTFSNNSASNTGILDIAGGIDTTVNDTRLILAGTNTDNNKISSVIGDGTGGASGIWLDKQGAGTWVLSANNLYSGATTVEAGTLIVEHGGALGMNGLLQGTQVMSGATLGLRNSITLAEYIMISGTGVGGLGALQNLANNNTVTGEVALLANSMIGAASGTTLVLSGVQDLAIGASTLTLAAVGDIEIGKDIIGTTGGIIKTGAGTVVLSGTNTYQGSTQINGGTVEISAAANLGDSTKITNTIGINAATLQSTGNTYALGVNRAIALNGAATIQVDADTLTVEGIISGSGALTKTGAGILELSGDNIYTSSTTISKGTLLVGHANALGTTAGGTSITATGAALDLNGQDISSEALSIIGTGVGGTGALTNTGAAATYGGVVTVGTGGASIGGTGDIALSAGLGSGANALSKTGTNVLTLGASSSRTGTLSIDEGTLQVGASGAMGGSSAVVTVADGAALDLNGVTYATASVLNLNGTGGGQGALTNSNATAASYAGAIILASSSEIDASSGALTLTGGITTAAGKDLTIDGANTTTVSGTGIAGAGDIEKTGSGTLALNAASTYTGDTLISVGTLKTGHASALGATSAGTTVASGATLDLNGAAVGVEAITINGTGLGGLGALINSSASAASLSGAVTLGADSTIASTGTGGMTLTGGLGVGTHDLTVSGDNTITVSGTGISGSGLLLKSGAGTLNLNTASDTYTGIVMIGGGTVAVTVDQALGTSAGNTVLNGGSLDFRGVTYATAEAVTLAGGSLAASSGVSSFTGVITLANTSTVSVTGTQLTLSGTIDDGGVSRGLSKEGAGKLVLSGANTYDGGTSVTAGVLNLQNNTASGTGNITVSSGAAVEVQGGVTLDNTLTLNNTGVSNGGALRSVSGDNIWAGAITATANPVRINTDAGTLGLTGGINNGGLLLSFGGAGSMTVSTVGISGAGGLLKDGNGTLFLNVASAYDGATTINSGTVKLGDVNALGSTAGATTVASGGVLDLNGTAVGSEALTLNGTGLGGTGALINSSALAASLSGAITLGSSSTIGSIGVGGLTLTGGIITASGRNVTFAGDQAATVSGTGITGDGGLVKTGDGILTISTANTYTGVTTISDGTVQITTATGLGTTDGGVSVAGGAILDLAGNIAVGNEAVALANGATLSSSSGANTLSGTVGITGTATVSVAGTSLGLSGVVSGNNLVKTGTGVLALSGSNTYSGSTTINGGTLQISAADNLGNGAATNTVAINNAALQSTSGTYELGANRDVTLTGTGTIQVDAGDLSVNGEIGGAGALEKTGAGTLTLSGTGANAYTGLTTVSAGTLALNKTSGVNAIAGNVTINGGTLLWLADEQIGDSSTITLTSGTLNLNGRTETVSGFVFGDGTFTTGGGNLIITWSGLEWSAGTHIITADSSISANIITITGGTNTVNGQGVGTTGGVLQLATGGTLNMSNGSTLTLDSDNGVAGKLLLQGDVSTSGNSTVTIASGGVLANSGTIDMAGGARTFTVADGTDPNDLAVSAVITNGSLIKAGAGTMLVSGQNTYTGATTVTAGTLKLGGVGVIADASALTVGTGLSSAILDLNGNNETIGSLAGNTLGVVTNSSVTGAILTAGGNNTSTTFAGTIQDGAGTVALAKAGTGALTLSGNNTYSGGTTLNAGTLNLGSAAAIGTGALTIAGGTLDNTSASALTLINNNLQNWNGNFAFTGTNALDLGTGAVTLSGDRTVTVNASTLTVGGVISGGTFGLTKAGAGTLVLSGNNIYDGATTVSAGTLRLGAVNVIDDESKVSVDSGATLDLNGNNETIASLAGAGSVTSTGAATLTSGDAAPTTFSGIISGAIGLTKVGSGALTLSGANTYTGGTILNAGTLNINHASALGMGLFTILGGTTIDNTSAGAITLTSNNIQIWNGDFVFTGTQNLNLGTGAVTLSGDRTVTVNAKTLTVGGVISGDHDLIKAGSGTLMLSGANTYTGDTKVNAGTLQFGAANVIEDTSAVYLASGATLALNGYSETIGSLEGASGAVVTNGAAAAAVLTTGGDNTSIEFAGTIQDGSTGRLSLVKTGTGVLELSGSNTYSGSTTINGGTLQISAADNLGNGAATNTVAINNATLQSTSNDYALGANRDVTLTGTGTIQVDAGDLTVDGEISGTGDLKKTGAGTLTLSGTGANTYTGMTTVSAGTLALDKTAGVNAIAGDVTINGGILMWLVDEQIEDSSTITLTSGTLNLNGRTETVNSFVFNNTGGIFTTGVGGHLIVTGNTLTWSGGINTVATSGSIQDSHIDISGGINTVQAGGTMIVDAGGIGLEMSNGSTLTLDSSAATPGKLLLKGDVTTSGNSTVTIASGGALANSGTIDLDGGARTFTVGDGTNANDLAVSAVITNGSLIKAGDGTMLLSGNNTYTGGTLLNAGTLNVNHASALGTGALTILGGTTINNTSGSAITIANDQNWNGDFTFTGTKDLALNGDVTLGADRTVTVSGGTLTVAGDIGGNHALTKTGTGTLTLDGADNSGISSMTVNAGTLNLNQGLANGLIYSGASIVNVADAKSLGGAVTTTVNGQGTLNFLGATITNASIGTVLGNRLLAVNFKGATTLAHDIAANTTTVNAGSSLALSGDRTVDGNLVVANNSTALLKTTLNSATDYGRVAVTGAATVGASSKVEVTNAMSGYVAHGLAFKIIDGTSGTGISTANIANWVIPGTLFWNMTVSGGEDLLLTVNRYSGYDVLATDKNTKAVGSVLEAIGQAGPSGDMLTVIDALEQAPSAGALQSALASMHPIMDNAIQQVQGVMLQDFIKTAFDRAAQSALDNHREGSGISAGDGQEENKLWGRLIGSLQEQKESGLSQGYSARTFGAVIGGDQQVPGRPLRLGTALGYATAEVDSDVQSGSTTISSYQGSVYGTYQKDGSPFFVDNALTFAYNTYDSSRRISGLGLDRTAKADYTGMQFAGMMEAGYIIRMMSVNFTPMASLQYSRLMIDGYTETGADALNLIVQDQTYSLLQSGIGFRLDFTFAGENVTWTPEFRVKWLRDFVSDRQQTKAGFAGGGGTFATEGAEPDPAALEIGGKLTMLTKENISFALNYDLLRRQGFYAHSGFAEVGLKW